MDINENINSWGADYDWTNHGEEWSKPWGDSTSQWLHVIYPRIATFLPADRILEVGIGHGRWTHFLRSHTTELIGVDLSRNCIKYCQKRFSKGQNSNVTCYQNDGLKFPMIQDNSIDFVFSFDSLVHADADVIQSYLKEVKRVLKIGGAAFVHHSNLLDCKNTKGLRRHVRARDVGHKLVKNFADSINLPCAMQELVNWRNSPDFLTDCFSTFIKNKPQNTKYRLFINTNFMEHAKIVKMLSHYY